MILRPLAGFSPMRKCEESDHITYLSWPMVSPEPSSLLQPEPVDSSDPSHSFSSSADMFTSSPNSLNWSLDEALVGVDRRLLDHCCIVLDHSAGGGVEVSRGKIWTIETAELVLMIDGSVCNW